MKKKGRLWILLMFVMLLTVGIMTTVKNDDVKAGEGEKSAAQVQLPDGFLTDVKIYKAVSPDYITFEEDKTEVKRDSAFSAEFEYKIPSSSDLPGGTAMAANVPYTFSVRGNFLKENIRFNIVSESTAKIVANGYVQGEKVVLTFNDQAVNESLLDEDTEGTFWFKGYFDKSKIENKGEQDFILYAANLQATAKVNFACDQIEASAALTKTGEVDLDNHKVKWKVKAVPEIKNANAGDEKFVKWSIKDKIPEKLTYVAENSGMGCFVEISTVSGGAVIHTEDLTGGSGSYDDVTKTFTYQFPENMEIKNKTFELTITTSFNPTESGFLNSSGKVVFSNQAAADFKYPQYEKDRIEGSATHNQVVISSESKMGEAVSNTASIEITGSTLTKSGALKNGNEIEWTIKAKNSFKLENPKLVDTLPAYTSIVLGSVTLDGSSINTTNSGGAYYEEGDGKITIHLDKTKSTEQTLKYKTKFDSEWKEHNTNGIISNKAEFYGGTGNGLLIGPKTANVNLNSEIMAKTGEYNRTNHTITWKIFVKNTGDGLTNIKFKDVIPTNQKYVTGSIAATGASIVIGTEGMKDTITLNYPDNYNSWSTNYNQPAITYQTKLTDDRKDLWGGNQSGKSVSNTISLTANGLPAKQLAVTGTAAVASNVLKKEYRSYDYTKKRVKWRLLVNDNQMTITDPKIIDEVTAGWKFAEDSIAVTQNGTAISTGVGINYNDTKSKMELTLPSVTAGNNAQPYTIEYETELVDNSILTTTNAIKASNTAILKGNEIAGADAGVSVTAAKDIAKPVLEKDGDNSTLNQGYLTWNIVVNRTMSEISAFGVCATVAVQDDIQNNLAPIMDSIKVYELGIAANGTETKNKELTKNSEYTASYDITTRKLIIDFGVPKIEKAYLITFHTDVAESGSYTNSVQFLGSSEADKKQTSGAVKAIFSGGTTRPVYGNIKIVKKNEENQVLEGAEFTIKSKATGAELGKGKTDNNGILEFSTLKAGDYVITETKAPVGYKLPDEASQDAVISKTNKNIELTIVNKKEAVSTPLPATPTPTPTVTPTATPTAIPTVPVSPTPPPTNIPPVIPPPPTIQPTPSAVPSVPPASSVPDAGTPSSTMTPVPSITPTPTIMPTPSKKPEKTAVPIKKTIKNNTRTENIIIEKKEQEKRKNIKKEVEKEDQQTRTENANINKRPPNENDRKKESENQDVPRTGDNTHFKSYCIIFAFSFILLLYCIRLHWKQIKNAKKDKRE